MNEREPDERAAVEQVLGHVLKREDGTTAKVEGAYNRALHLDRRRRLLHQWSTILVISPAGSDQLLSNVEIL